MLDSGLLRPLWRQAEDKYSSLCGRKRSGMPQGVSFLHRNEKTTQRFGSAAEPSIACH
jgi:hypothetical protein